jgi:hypothetical protein
MDGILGGLVAVTLVGIGFVGFSTSYQVAHDSNVRLEQAQHPSPVAVEPVSVGGNCSVSGQLGQMGSGSLAFCQQGTWQAAVPQIADPVSPSLSARHLLDAAQHISGALVVYANDHDGRYPDELSALLADKLVSNEDIYTDGFQLLKSQAGKYSLRAQIHDAKACVAVDKASGVKNADVDSPFALSLQSPHSPYSCVGTAEVQQFTFDL